MTRPKQITKEPVEQTKSLKDECPICGDSLYAYWDTPAGDHPELGAWHVECRVDKCKYRHDGCFPDIESLSKRFNICNKQTSA